MAKRGGFPGAMPGNMNNLMKQAQKMQKQMADMQDKMKLTDFIKLAKKINDGDDLPSDYLT